MPELVLELNGRTWTLDASRPYTLGRDPQGDIVLEDARVSWRHATISWDGRSWVVEDHGSTNGTFVQGQRIHRTEIGPGSALHLGNATDGPRLNLSGAAAAVAQPQQQPYAAQGASPGWAQPAPQQQTPEKSHQQPQQPAARVPQQQGPGGGAGAPPVYGDRSPTTFYQLDLGRVMRIGRALENELVVSDLQVSRHHAEFHATPDGRFEIRDLGSHNGTYVNGMPIAKGGSALLGPNDIVGVGHSTFRLVGDHLEEFVDTGEVSFSARHLTVTVDGGKQILKDVSFGVPEKSLIAVIGPSGSGKSTLLKALTGYRPANQGDVLYDNRNLYKQFAELRQRIGLVPQDDILHKELTVKKALKYAAKLRFPADTTGEEREARIDEVLRELKLDIHKEKKVTSLSGGQRKRVSVALELLTKPSLIFLDEPTSGLDPGMDRDVMQLLRGLADDGRTVLVVTHSVAELAICDKLLVMAPGGSVAYFGPPEEALNFFGYETWADVFSAFENYRDYDWAGRWKGSQHYQMYAADIDAVAPQSANVTPPQAMKPPKPQGWFSQLSTLVRRYVSVIVSDRGFLALTVILPAVLGAVSLLIDPDKTLLVNAQVNPKTGVHVPNGTATTVLLILAVGACFAGAANSVRELIKERVIYERERATGLSRSAYLMSKVVVLGVITVLQGAMVGAIGFTSRTKPTEGLVFGNSVLLELSIPIMALGFTSMMFGLVISSLVKTSEKTMPLLVMFAIIQVVFTGCLFILNGKIGVNEFSYLMPSRWAVGAAGATLDFNNINPNTDDPSSTDPLWNHTASAYGMDIVALLVLAAVCGFFVARFLRRHEPEVMRK
ncbi:FHA domain-containing protein [Streptomyces sp. NBC_01340]|uniref:ABC transporter ATP-binding protein/permease n=1 Tax=unclassified Streptomyces TaxID=2593676 RepID=UPI00225BBE2E|nr:MULTISPECIES: FHA domain-containing protein [unclassified Streptomyces]MCX4453161.1 FHA domain-containing protein [Streptomyces sp. NBC_01719]MCX4492521.1 FHA domain-containing protein [Streptomyces sp. NBC_01728]WSI44059.1 FHA domain-containing protein [Streptomyces sp. NBC_01340]